MDPLHAFLEATVKFARKVRNGSYAVHRGAVNWAAWPWKDRPKAWAILVDSTSLFPVEGGIGNAASISFEVFVQGDQQKWDYGIDDRLLSDMRADVRDVIQSLIAANNDQGDPVVFALHEGDVMVTEALDAEQAVQGVVVTFGIRY